MKYNFDEIVDRNGTNCLKYDALERFFGANDLLPMWVADSDFRVPEFITEAIMQRVKHPVLGYTYRDDEFYDSIIKWVAVRGDWSIEKDWILYSAGVVAGIGFAMNALTRQGAGVLIQTPVYPPFSMMVENNNRRLFTNVLIDNNGHYEIDFEDFENKLKEVDLFIMCNPHNPVGRVFTHEELKQMGDLCVKYGVYIISDEIHSDIIMPPHRHIHIASLSKEIAERTVTLMAPSKTFNIAGLATSITIISNPKLRKSYLQELDKFHLGGGNIFGIEALTAAYQHGGEWVDDMNAYLSLNMDYVESFCHEFMPKVRVIRPEATYLMWLDFNALSISEDALQHSLIYDGKVALNKGSDYGITGEGFMRLNVSTPLSVVKEAMRRIKISYDTL